MLRVQKRPFPSLIIKLLLKIVYIKAGIHSDVKNQLFSVRKILLNLFLLVFGFTLAACVPANEVVEVTRVVATAVPATSIAPSPIPPTLTPTGLPETVEMATAVARATAPLPADPQTYTNTELGFSLQYAPSWQLEVQNEAEVLSLTLNKQGYELQLRLRPQTNQDVSCGGLFAADDSPDNYWHDTIAGQAWWRPKAEAGISNGYHDDTVTFLEIIAPMTLYQQPTAQGYLGEFTCLLPMLDKWVTVNYLLPVSQAELVAGEYDAHLLAEMDHMVASLVFMEMAATVTETAVATTPTPTPAITRSLQTDQVILFAHDNELWRSDVDGTRVEQLTTGGFLGWDREEADFRDLRPHLSPDGRYAAQFTSPDTTRIVDLATGNELTIPFAWEVAWSPDSRLLAFANQGIKAIDVVSSVSRNLVTLPGEALVSNMVWSPDGTKLAYDCCFTEREPYDGYSDGEIRVIDLATGIEEIVAETWAGIASGPPDFCWTEDGQVTLEIAYWMRPCSRNYPFDALPIISVDNLEAKWEANMAEDGTWLNTRLFAINRATGQLAWERTLELPSFLTLAWSPDGRYLFYDDQASDSPIWRLTADGADLVEIIPSGQLLGVVEQWDADIFR